MLERAVILDEVPRRPRTPKYMEVRQMGRWDASPSVDFNRGSVAIRLSANAPPARGTASLPTITALLIMWCLIGLVAAYDTYLLVKLQESIVHFEKNPLGLLLLELDNGSVALFVACKLVGTSIVLGAIPVLYFCKRSWGLTVASALTAVQLAVLIILTLP